LVLQRLLSYYITNEIKTRSKTSILLRCYVSCVFLIFLPYFLEIVLFQRIIQIQSLLNFLFLVFFLFFPLNLDIFSREYHFDMLDHLVMNSEKFKIVYLARIIANGIIMISPIFLGFICILVPVFTLIGLFYSLELLVFFLIVLLFFFLWYLIFVLVLGIIELNFPDSMIRSILYFSSILGIIGILFFTYERLNTQPIIIGIFLGQDLFDNLSFALIEISISCLITQLILYFVINKQIDHLIGKVLLKNPKINNDIYSSKYHLYSIRRILGFGNKSLKQKIIPFLGSVALFFFFLSISDSIDSIAIFLNILGVFFFIILLYTLFIVFPRITVEKKYNMEELLLSRISIHFYFLEKLTFLLKSIIYPLLFTFMMLIILVRPSLPDLTLITVFIIVHTFYFVSILLFMWRFFPTKSLLQSTFLSILGFEITGILFLNFLFPTNVSNNQTLNLFFSPIISSLDLSGWVLNPISDIPIWDLTWILLLLSIVFFLGALVLLKSEAHFE